MRRQPGLHPRLGGQFGAGRDALRAGPRSNAGRLCPICLFVDPPLARVGLSEAEARAVLRTRTTGLTEGFMKAVVGSDDRILGFAMLGTDAGEVMAAVQVAMLAGLPYTALRDAILAHPTTAEGLNALFAAVPAR
jgi:pyruvate/2-oxoglutarate dehydrogenase complex dihydrolipoamide dehydrogenase (E3) component